MRWVGVPLFVAACIADESSSAVLADARTAVSADAPLAVDAEPRPDVPSVADAPARVDASPRVDATVRLDAHPPIDATVHLDAHPRVDAAPIIVDGPPTRQACTGSFGNALTTVHGRLDGYLVSIVPPGGPAGCNADSQHLHLQVKMNGKIYDVAITAYDSASSGMFVTDRNLAIPDAAWSEGWHPNL